MNSGIAIKIKQVYKIKKPDILSQAFIIWMG